MNLGIAGTLNLRRGVYERVAEQSGDVAGLIVRWLGPRNGWENVVKIPRRIVSKYYTQILYIWINTNTINYVNYKLSSSY